MTIGSALIGYWCKLYEVVVVESRFKISPIAPLPPPTPKKIFLFSKNYFLTTYATWTLQHLSILTTVLTLIYHRWRVPNPNFILGKFLVLICHQRPRLHPTPPKLRNVRFSTKIGTETIFGARKRKMLVPMTADPWNDHTHAPPSQKLRNVRFSTKIDQNNLLCTQLFKQTPSSLFTLHTDTVYLKQNKPSRHVKNHNVLHVNIIIKYNSQ